MIGEGKWGIDRGRHEGALRGTITLAERAATSRIELGSLKENETGLWPRRGAVVERYPVRSTGH